MAKTKSRWSRELSGSRTEATCLATDSLSCFSGTDYRPLGSQDWPEGEKPPPGYFAHRTASPLAASGSSEALAAAAAHKHDTALPGEQVGGGGGAVEAGEVEPAGQVAAGARFKSIPGLEEEVQFLNTYGQDVMDDVLEETPRTAALFELDGMCILDDDYDDDRETDEGTDESFDDEEPAKKKAKVWEDPAAGKKKVRPSGRRSPLREDLTSLRPDPPRSCSGRFGHAMTRTVPSPGATARTKTSPWS